MLLNLEEGQANRIKEVVMQCEATGGVGKKGPKWFFEIGSLFHGNQTWNGRTAAGPFGMTLC